MVYLWAFMTKKKIVYYCLFIVYYCILLFSFLGNLYSFVAIVFGNMDKKQ